MTCPICSGRVPEVGVNDLATANPMLTSEWHPIRNGNKKPQDFLPKSNQKYGGGIGAKMPTCGTNG